MSVTTIQKSNFWGCLCEIFEGCNNYIIPVSNKVDHTLIFYDPKAYLSLNLSKREK